MASTGIGAKVFIDGEKEVKQAISNINTQYKIHAEQLKKVSNEYSSNSKSVDALSARNKILNSQLTDQKSKLRSAEDGLESAISAYGDADKRTDKWRLTIAKTETEISKLEKEIRNNEDALNDASNSIDEDTDSLDDFTEGLGTAGDGTIKFSDLIKANLISDAIVAGIKALGTAMKEVGSAIIDIGKQSIESFADYEQLVGGVETLFGESSDIVLGYANNAYKSAGLSANEYMETVTSFSASLLQSLNGDTAQSAKVADMAITDMADNANKMGTSMESIQDAYQGFAKQNYTMLDNLKLGYGGTKSEMERLLADATALTGIDYDISSLNDVYQAIHVVQTELGITGTTAKEANETISGSISAMKSSWTNLITGLADGNADLTTLIDNVVDSAMTVADNILPVIEQVADSILEVLPTLLDKIIEELPRFLETGSNILKSIITGLQSNMSSIMTAVMQIVNMLINTIVENLPLIIEMGIQMLVSLVQGIAESLPELVPTIVEAIILIVDTLLDNIDLIIEAGINILLALIEGIFQALPTLIGKIPELIASVLSAVITNAPKLLSGGVELVVKIAQGLGSAIGDLGNKAGELVNEVWNKFKNTDWIQLGKDILGGIGNGIKNAVSSVVDSAKNACNDIYNGVKNFFGIKSPSRLMRDGVGIHLADGIGVGFVDEMEQVGVDMQNAIPTDYDIKTNLSNDINTNYDTQTQSLLSGLTELFANIDLKAVVNLDNRQIAEAQFPLINRKLELSYVNGGRR